MHWSADQKHCLLHSFHECCVYSYLSDSHVLRLLALANTDAHKGLRHSSVYGVCHCIMHTVLCCLLVCAHAMA
jgi:hypothetical protein